ncbi:hypothetical protein CK501_11400 [Halovibrio salipaludis]|uniref:Uncharacterized protein n=1 Tax=Halovibrio salipaludis TaxID=2032626 RepID=A0A2A2F4S0_9GAMM|nr:hypothetical protein [Halovibrio salipaludis]PAU79800.1 hypothetical protein CK501_11400 [Halovibrio salipaludis]
MSFHGKVAYVDRTIGLNPGALGVGGSAWQIIKQGATKGNVGGLVLSIVLFGVQQASSETRQHALEEIRRRQRTVSINRCFPSELNNTLDRAEDQMTQLSDRRIFRVAGLGLAYFLLLNLFSTVAIVVDIWLGIKGQLGGNAAATIISSVIVIKMSRGLLSLSNKHVVAPFAAIAGLSSLAFLAFLHAASGAMENYDFPPITAVQAVTVIVFNAIIFIATVFFMDRGSQQDTA